MSGILNWVTGYIGYSNVPAEQQGNYLALTLTSDVEGATITASFDGKTVTLGEDNTVVIRFTDGVNQVVFTATKEGYSTGVMTLDLSEINRDPDTTTLTTLTGALPLYYNGLEQTGLVNYKFYGTSDGVGTATENLFTEEDSGLVQINSSGGMRFGKDLGAFEAGTYTLSAEVNSATHMQILITTVTNGIYSSSADLTLPYTFTLSSAVDKLIVRTSRTSDSTWVRDGYTNIMLVEGSTVPEIYIPYGYKIPVINSQNLIQDEYDIYIGDTKLGAEEYLDYSEQKIYKYIDNVLTPIDPPEVFPGILAYEGENILSSTEIIDNAEITGLITPTYLYNESPDHKLRVYSDGPFVLNNAIQNLHNVNQYINVAGTVTLVDNIYNVSGEIAKPYTISSVPSIRLVFGLDTSNISDFPSAPYFTPVEFVSGGWSRTNNILAPIDNVKQCRALVPVIPGKHYHISCPTEYELIGILADADMNAPQAGGSWAKAKSYTPGEGQVYLGIHVRRSDGADMTESDIANMSKNVQWVSSTLEENVRIGIKIGSAEEIFMTTNFVRFTRNNQYSIMSASTNITPTDFPQDVIVNVYFGGTASENIISTIKFENVEFSE